MTQPIRCCKRCAPGTLCCVYNRIAVSIKDETVLNQLHDHGYPLQVNGTIDVTQTNPVNTQTYEADGIQSETAPSQV